MQPRRLLAQLLLWSRPLPLPPLRSSHCSSSNRAPELSIKACPSMSDRLTAGLAKTGTIAAGDFTVSR
jgi:hypothetical protein